MSKLRTLLLALTFPVLLLPDGIVVCLHRLAGRSERAERCGSRCCSTSSEPDGGPSLSKEGCEECCVAVPETRRSLDPAPAQRGPERLAATFVLAPPPAPIAAVPPRSPWDAAWSAHHDPPSASIVLISLPLRL
jgi:hypothetical protein